MAQQIQSQRKALDQHGTVEGQRLRLNRKSVDLASEMLSLVEKTHKAKEESITNLEQVEEIARLEREVKASRQRWRVMKGTASAIVAGSGVDWARNEELRNMVLDDDGV